MRGHWPYRNVLPYLVALIASQRPGGNEMIGNASKLWYGGIFAVVLLIQVPNLSASENSLDWNVVVASEAVVTHKAATSTEALSIGSIVLAGDKLVTLAGGAAVLSRGDDLITMGENSEISITDPQPA